MRRSSGSRAWARWWSEARWSVWIVAALEGAVVVGGLSALGGGLYSIGIPRDSILKYEREIASDHFLLVAHGTKEEVRHAKNILDTTGARGVETHVTPGFASPVASS